MEMPEICVEEADPESVLLSAHQKQAVGLTNGCHITLLILSHKRTDQ